MLSQDYAPRKWSDIKFQDHIVNVLRNSITLGKQPRNIFLQGGSGSGKTSIANVYAASLVCSSPDAEGNPCGACDNCKDIFEDKFNRSVKRVNGSDKSGNNYYRDLLETFVETVSFYGKRKVIIIDECQGLSDESLDLLLVPMESKNLDDVYFIFLTTEMGVVKRTLETRCLFFRLNAPDELEMTKHFIGVLKDMKLRIPESFFIEGLLPIVMSSDGSLRKVFSILEQVILSKDFSSGNVYNLTSGVSDVKINSFILNILEGKISLAYADFDSIFKGKSPTDVFGVIMKLVLNINKYCVLGLDPDGYQGKGIRKMFSGVDSKRITSLLTKFYEIKKVCGYYIDKYVIEYILFGS